MNYYNVTIKYIEESYNLVIYASSEESVGEQLDSCYPGCEIEMVDKV